MINLSTRAVLTLREVLTIPGPVTIAALAHKLRISPRAIRYDLEAVDAWLRDRGLPRLGRHPGVGIVFAGTESSREAALHALEAMTPDLYVARPQERVQLLLSMVLIRDRPLSFKSLRMRLDVSKSTLTRTIREAAEWLSIDKLDLHSLPPGLLVVGEEADRRRAILRLLSEVLDTESKLGLLRSCGRTVPSMRQLGPCTELIEWISNSDLECMERCALQAQADLDVRFTDESLANLVLSLAVIAQRNRQGASLVSRPDPLGTAGPQTVSRAAVRMAEAIERGLDLTLPPPEVENLDSLLRRMSRQSGGSAVDARDLALRIVLQAEGALGCPLAEDQALLEALALHLGPALARLEQGFPTPPNPLLQEVQQQYPLLFQVARWAAEQITRQVGVTVTEEEAGYIAMHLGAAMERKRRCIPEPSRILVVCPSGLASGQLLAARLQAEFPVGVTTRVVSLHDLRTEAREADLVVSTVPVELEGVSSVTAHPLLPAIDVVRISLALGRKGWTPTVAGLLDTIMSLVARHAVIADPPGLRRELSSLLASRPITPLQQGGQPMLTELLSARTIRLDVEVADWEDAIRAAGDLLVAEGSATGAYVDAMVQTVRTMGPYIVLVPGVAVAHARTAGHVLRVGMSMVRLRRPVAFGAGANDPVDLVLAFCSPDHESHLRALADLAGLLGEADAMKRLRTAEEVAVVMQLIAAREKGGEAIH